jgi:hypothetical protein
MLICQSWLQHVPNWLQEALKYHIILSNMITPCSKLTRSSRISYLFIKHDYTLSQTDNKQLYNIISYWFVNHDYTLSLTDNKKL